MATWTNAEQRLLVEAHKADTHPTISQLAALLPRHTAVAVRGRAYTLGLRERHRDALHWLTVAHAHYAKRESEIRAFNQERYG